MSSSYRHQQCHAGIRRPREKEVDEDHYVSSPASKRLPHGYYDRDNSRREDYNGRFSRYINQRHSNLLSTQAQPIQIHNMNCTLYVSNIATKFYNYSDIRNELFHLLTKNNTNDELAIMRCDIFVPIIQDNDRLNVRSSNNNNSSTIYRACVEFKKEYMAKRVLNEHPLLLNGKQLTIMPWKEFDSSKENILSTTAKNDNKSTKIVSTVYTNHAVQVRNLPMNASREAIESCFRNVLQQQQNSCSLFTKLENLPIFAHCRIKKSSIHRRMEAYIEFKDRDMASTLMKVCKQAPLSLHDDNRKNSDLRIERWRGSASVWPYFGLGLVEGNGDHRNAVIPEQATLCESRQDHESNWYDREPNHGYYGPPQNMQRESTSNHKTSNIFAHREDPQEYSNRTNTLEDTCTWTTVETRNDLDSCSSLQKIEEKSDKVVYLERQVDMLQDEIYDLKQQLASSNHQCQNLQQQLFDERLVMADDQVQIYQELHKEQYRRQSLEDELREGNFRNQRANASSNTTSTKIYRDIVMVAIKEEEDEDDV